MPPAENAPTKAGAMSTRAASQRRPTGSKTKRRMPVASQAIRSVQSASSWWKPSAIAGASNKKDPAG